MTVAELIEELKKYPQDIDANVYNLATGEYEPVLKIKQRDAIGLILRPF